MEGWSGGLNPRNADEDIAEVLLQLRALSDSAKALAMKWNKEYTVAWRQAEHLKNSEHRCGSEQGCPLINARCAAASAQLRYKSALHFAMSFMSFALQGFQGLRANLGQLQGTLQELVSGGVQGGDCFMAACGDQVQQLWAKLQGLGGPPRVGVMGMGMAMTMAMPVPAAKHGVEAEGGQCSRKRCFEDPASSLEGECWSFQHQDKRRKQR